MAASVPLRIFASHGFAVEQLHQLLTREQFPLELRYCNSDQAAGAAVHTGMCDVGGMQLPVGQLRALVLAHYARC